MPTITLDKETVLKLSKTKLNDKDLAEKISMMGSDLDEINKDEIIVEIFPNRPDLLSEQGFARALSSFLAINTGLKEYKSEKSDYKMIIEESVKDIRPYTACAVVKNIKMDDEKIREIIQIQEKLHVTYGRNRKKTAIGIYPLDKISFPIYFKAMLPNEIKFQPLESNKEMTGKEILEKHPTGKEYAHLLEGKKLYPIFVDSNNKVLSMPPVINSHDTGRITEDTKDVFIECSGFDKNVLSKCLNMIVTALSDMGGKIYSMEIENKHENTKYILPDFEPEKMKIDPEYVKKVLGIDMKEKEIRTNLEKMGYGVKGTEVLIPCYRSDVISQIDLVEDIAIAHGFDNFSPTIPNVSTIGKESDIEKFKQKLREVLIGLGMFETKTYNISSSVQQTEMMHSKISLVKLANSLTVDYDCLRAWIIPNLMDVLKNNKRYDYPQKYFDLGRIFKETGNDETGITEHERLAVAICDKEADYTKIKKVLDTLFKAIGMNYIIKADQHDSFVPGRVARISIGKKDIAYIGEIHPKVLENFEIEMPVCALEINITELFEIFSENN
ncbi:MAG: phenylalanine--tRNA ligase subunit beta [Candidatus Woesearchaeota archaeon]